ncbi:hypothetical protein B0H13DRAFT_1870041 [Mycena leptocephala]|nr:hypothetical protein B0H13DRAFT_1870041 [Mycena leptocephala]
MPVVHYRRAAVASVPPATTKNAVVTTKKSPVTKVPVVPTAKTVATAKVPPTTVVPSTTTAVPPTTVIVLPSSSSIIPSPTLPPVRTTAQLPTKTAAAHTSTVSSASPSVSVPPSSTSAFSITPIIAGIAGSLAGVAVTALLIAFFFRRWNRRSRGRGRESINFEPKAFRRSALMLEDPRPPRAPAFSNGNGSIRSVQMDYQHAMAAGYGHPPMAPYHQYPVMMQSPTSVYTPDSPRFGTLDSAAPRYATPEYFSPQQQQPHQYYAPPVQQGYPLEFHRQGSLPPGDSTHLGASPLPSQPHHQYAENNDDAYAGMVNSTAWIAEIEIPHSSAASRLHTVSGEGQPFI